MSVLTAGLRPRAILLDLRMDWFNGIDFRRARLAEPSLRAIPVVAMTGNPATLEEHPDLPWTGVLHKPLVIDELVGVLRRGAAQLALNLSPALVFR
jgi:CheY-like chemotaxis protein